MSRFNDYAKELDKAFRDAREEFKKLRLQLDMAKVKEERIKNKTVDGNLIIATEERKEMERKLAKENRRIWEDFDSKAREIRGRLEKAVQTDDLANPDAVNVVVLELLKSGALTVADYKNFMGKYESNPTMMRLLGSYAARDAKERGGNDEVQLSYIASVCRNGAGKTLESWENLAITARTCSGRDHQGAFKGGTYNFETFETMMDNWEMLAGEGVERF